MNPVTDFSKLDVLVLLAVAWVVLIALFRGLLMPRLIREVGSAPQIGFLVIFTRAMARTWHRLVAHGTEILPRTNHPGGLIVVSNHTCGLDPVIIQVLCPFHIRWMMAREMMNPGLDWLWRLERIIPVERNGKDTGPTREAIRHVKAGGIIGIFPEGRISPHPGELLPFHPGVGLLVARTKAPVLLCWISGTPQTTDIGKSLITRSHARVEFIDLIDFRGERHAETISRALRERLAEASGWPFNDNPPPLEKTSTDPFLV